MPQDKREQILVRLTEILSELAASSDSSIQTHRNRAEFEMSELPAFVLLDGLEETEVKSKDRRGPQIMRLMPQIFYVPIPPENQLNDGIGPLLSDYRIRMIKSIILDGALETMIGDNGYVEYRGMETDMQTGGEVKGQFRMDFAFAYVFNFYKL